MAAWNLIPNFLDLFQVSSLLAPKRNPPRSASLTDPVPAFYLRVIPLGRVRVVNRIAGVLPPLWETLQNRQGRHLRKKNLERVPRIERHLLWLEVLPLPRWVIVATDRPPFLLSFFSFFFFFFFSTCGSLLPTCFDAFVTPSWFPKTEQSLSLARKSKLAINWSRGKQ